MIFLDLECILTIFMNVSKSNLCLRITQKIMQQSICKPFLLHESHNINSDLKKTDITLEKIRDNLLTRNYESFDQWKSDMDKFFEQAQYSASIRHQHYIFCIKDLENIYKKAISKTTVKGNPIQALDNAYESFVKILNDAPTSLGDLKAHFSRSQKSVVFSEMTALELELLGEALSSIKSEECMRGVQAIVECFGAYGRNSRGDITFEVNAWSPQCAHSVCSYLREQFKKEGIKYPE